MRSKVTAEVLEKVAKGLGLRWLEAGIDDDNDNVRWLAGDQYKNRIDRKYSDGDLLLAILNRAAEMGVRHRLIFLEDSKRYLVEFNHSYGREDGPAYRYSYAAVPLEAAMLAFAQLEPPHDR